MSSEEAMLTFWLVVVGLAGGACSTGMYALGVSHGHEYERSAQALAVKDRTAYVEALEKRLAVLTNPPVSATKAKVQAEAMP
jgi:hypothetical protein